MPHWLAVDGVQPTIPENASLERPKAKRQRRANQPATAAGASPSAGPAAKGTPAAEVAEEANGASAVRAPVKHVLSQVGLDWIRSDLQGAKGVTSALRTGHINKTADVIPPRMPSRLPFVQ